MELSKGKYDIDFEAIRDRVKRLNFKRAIDKGEALNLYGQQLYKRSIRSEKIEMI